MGLYHNYPISLGTEGTKACLAYQKAAEALFFVHGFNGTAIKSWGKFFPMITDSPLFENCDLFFYGYDSFSPQIENSAIRFERFVSEILIARKYQKIVIAAHSLGAIIVRRGMLNANIKGASWLKSCKMVLFAPAHHGSKIQGLLLEVLKGPMKILAVGGRFFFPVIDELRESSATITVLKDETMELLKQEKGSFTIAFAVLCAGKETVVINRRFGLDPIAEEAEFKNHVNICKPDDDFKKPYNLIMEACRS